MAVGTIRSRRRRGYTVDRISELPDSICHHILSFLTAKHAGRALFLSKRWQALWYSSPVYDFNERYFIRLNQQFWQASRFWRLASDDQDPVSCSTKFLSLLEATLHGCRQTDFSHLGIEKFKICLSRTSVDTPIILEWIVFAVKRNVRELIILNSRRFSQCTIIDSAFPDVIFTAKYITKLELANFCIYEIPADFAVSLACLQQLVLTSMWITGSTLRKLFCGCPIVKKLYLDSLRGPTEIKLVAMDTLTELKVWRSGDMDVVIAHQPNLKSLVCTGRSFDRKGSKIEVQNLRSFVLKDVAATDAMVENILVQNPHLENLTLENCNVEKLRIISPKLKSLSWSDQFKWLVEVKIEAPELVELKCCGNIATFSTVIASSFLKASISLSSCGHKSSTLWYAQLKEMCNKLQNSQVLSLMCSEDLDLIIPGNMRISLLPQVLGLKHLKVRVLSSESHGDELEEGLRWIFPRLTTLEISHDQQLLL